MKLYQILFLPCPPPPARQPLAASAACARGDTAENARLRTKARTAEGGGRAQRVHKRERERERDRPAPHWQETRSQSSGNADGSEEEEADSFFMPLRSWRCPVQQWGEGRRTSAGERTLYNFWCSVVVASIALTHRVVSRFWRGLMRTEVVGNDSGTECFSSMFRSGGRNCTAQTLCSVFRAPGACGPPASVCASSGWCCGFVWFLLLCANCI